MHLFPFLEQDNLDEALKPGTIRLDEAVTDGTSNTLMIGERVTWLKEPDGYDAPDDDDSTPGGKCPCVGTNRYGFSYDGGYLWDSANVEQGNRNEINFELASQ
ncbi:DUF1559 domain-containing protein [Bremerella cremea]|uniref:DUF1559 family PulG-like putative transporter n=1 Tax=Bremerella cremea TaxID=1031537 RepID=UPI0031E7D6C9